MAADGADRGEGEAVGEGVGLAAQLRRLLANEVDIRLPITLAVRREAATHPAVRAVGDALRLEVADRTAELLQE